MNKLDRHIVSKINWDLAYDNRSDVQALQSTFGSWTKVDMLNEMNALFNQLCPSDQTWRINRLELDLGEMLKGDIDDELPTRFRAALYEKLIELTYRSGRGDHELRVLDGNDSLLNLLKKYLESGYLPWNETGVVSINQLFINQLKNNRKPLLKMILQAGQSEKVRKRIAWQFQEPTIKQVIGLIEPHNSKQIITFVEEFVNIQEKEAIVRSNVSDFKKNLWFWVLNHLFSERGTLFNRIDFMESSIHQMARHHNMDFATLFDEIQRAVQQITASQHLDSDFMLVLSLVAKKKARTSIVNNIDNQSLMIEKLNEYFNNDSKASAAQSIQNWNELVIHLAAKNSKEFKRVMSQHSDNKERLNELLINLDEAGQEALLKTLFTTNSNRLIASIQLLSEWIQKPRIELFKWYQTAAHILVNENLQDIDLEQFLIRLIKTLKLEPKALFTTIGQMLKNNGSNAGVQPQVFKSTMAIVRNYYFEYMESATKWTVIPYLHFFLSEEWNILSIESRIEQIKGQNKFTSFIGQEPELFLAFIQEQKWSKSVLEKFVGLLEYKHIEQLRDSILQTSSKSNRTEDKEFEILLASLSTEIGVTFAAKMYKQALTETIQKKLTGKSRAEFLMKRIIQIIQQDGNSRLKIELRNFSSKMKENSVLKKIFKQELSSTLRIVSPSFNSIIANIAVGKGDSAHGIAKQLQQIRETSGKDWVKTFNQSAQTIVSHFLPTKKKWAAALSVGNLNLNHIFDVRIQTNLSAKRLSVIFWNVLLAYDTYQGDFRRFKTLLQKAITIRSEQVKSSVKVPIKHKSVPIRTADRYNTLIERLKQLSLNRDLKFKPIALNDDIRSLIADKPIAFAEIFNTVKVNNSLLDYFEKHFALDQFVLAFANFSTIRVSEFQATLSFLKALVNHKGDRQTHLSMRRTAWKMFFAQLQNDGSITESISELVRVFIKELVLKKGLKTNDVYEVVQSQNIQLNPIVLKLLVKMNPVFAEFNFNQEGTTIQEKTNESTVLKPAKSAVLELESLIKSELGQQLLHFLLMEHKIPNWFDIPDFNQVDSLTKFIIREYPQVLLSAINQSHEFEPFVQVLQKEIRLATWFNFLKTVFSSQNELINQLNKLFNCFSAGEFSRTLKTQLNEILFRKTAIAIKTGNWKILSSEIIWNEIMWDAKVKYARTETEIIKAIQQNEAYLPVGLRVSFQRFIEKLNGPKKIMFSKNLQEELPLNKKDMPMEEDQPLLTEGIAINNAGLVLASSYINILFDRLNLIKDGNFVSAEAQNKAVHYLQFLVNGISENEEHYLVLNKILAGLHPTSPVTSGIDINTTDKELIEGLIKAIIDHWPAIGDTSVDGFRGNWVIRDGVLREEVDRWTLDVEKRAYDILLNKSPFSFGIIKFPWIEKPIHVNWLY